VGYVVNTVILTNGMLLQDCIKDVRTALAMEQH
jgi:hypothetical protein